MPEALTLPCPACGTLNRVPRARLADRGRCGHCHEPLFTGLPLALTAESFARHAETSDLPLLIDFWAQWCGPCRAMAPVLEELGRAMAGKIVVAKLNVDEAPEPARTYAVQGIPTLILFRGGREVERIVGARPLSELRRAVEQGAMSVSLS